jgi:nucleoside-diphosphate-sugar epimerase
MATSVLVTGATGFVGSHVLEALQENGRVEVIAACRDRTRLPNGFSGQVRQGDLRDPGYRESLVGGIDVVCHAAAWTSLWGHEDESRRLFREPTLALIRAARAAGVKRFINTSTTSAAAPERSADPMSRGIPRSFWPHLCNVIAVEDFLREAASPSFQVINLRLGIFAGRRYGLGVLPILAARLRTHLVPWVAGGRTSLPIVGGRDIGQAFERAATVSLPGAYEGFNIVGPEVPSVREVIGFLHDEFGLPKPHFGVPFAIAYPFAWLMEKLDPVVPWDPLVTRSIIHLVEEVNADNAKAELELGYHAAFPWRETIREQMAEMSVRQLHPMKMAVPAS